MTSRNGCARRPSFRSSASVRTMLMYGAIPVTVETRKCWLCPDLTSTLKIPFAFLRMKTESPACSSYSLGESAPSGTLSMKNSSSGSYGLETMEKARSSTLSWLSTPKATYWPALKASVSVGFIQTDQSVGEESCRRVIGACMYFSGSAVTAPILFGGGWAERLTEDQVQGHAEDGQYDPG